MDNEKRIALIDDLESNLLMYSRALESIPEVTVVAFSDPKQAFDDISNNNGYDLIVTDIVMPSMSGTSLIRRLRNLPDLDYWVIAYSCSKDNLQDAETIKHVAAIPLEGTMEENCEALKGIARRVLIDSENDTKITNIQLDIRRMRSHVKEIQTSLENITSSMPRIEDIKTVVETAVGQCKASQSVRITELIEAAHSECPARGMSLKELGTKIKGCSAGKSPEDPVAEVDSWLKRARTSPLLMLNVSLILALGILLSMLWSGKKQKQSMGQNPVPISRTQQRRS